jgi:tRNA pseudouridine55 synthase
LELQLLPDLEQEIDKVPTSHRRVFNPETVKQILGEIDQKPPIFSAIKG